MTLASIVVAAHNESSVIRRLLSQLVGPALKDELDIVVVANGCTDDTAEVARSFGPPVQVLSLATASKREALAAGNRAATAFPRVYVDADVELGAGGRPRARLCAAASRNPGRRTPARACDGGATLGRPVVLRRVDPASRSGEACSGVA